MKAAVCLLLPMLLVAPIRADDSWIDFQAPDGRFLARFPGRPATATQTVNSASGEELQYTTIVSELEQGAITFGIAFCDYPTDVPAEEVQKILDSGRDGVQKNLGGELVAETPMTLHGYPAREFTIKASYAGEPLLYHTRIVLIERRLYQLQVIRVGTATVNLPDVIDFFAAFEPQPAD